MSYILSLLLVLCGFFLAFFFFLELHSKSCCLPSFRIVVTVALMFSLVVFQLNIIHP